MIMYWRNVTIYANALCLYRYGSANIVAYLTLKLALNVHLEKHSSAECTLRQSVADEEQLFRYLFNMFEEA